MLAAGSYGSTPMKSYKVVEFGKPLERVEESNPAPQGAEVLVRSSSSLYLWAALPGIDDSLEFAKALLPEKIVIAPGRVFRVDSGAPSAHARYNVGAMADPRFARALKAILKRA